MPVITENTIRRLAEFKTEGAAVTSCYLDVDGRRLRRHQDVEHELDVLLRKAKDKANGSPSVHQDLSKIESFVRGGFDRSRVRGLAIFSCAERELWEVIELPVPVRSRLIVNSAPAVAQLESVVQEYDRFGVLLVDRQRARMFVFELGELIDRSELFDELPRDYDTRGERERGDVANHVDALAQQHLRRAAEVAFKVYQEQAFQHLTIGAPDSIVSELESMLHPYLRERLSLRIPVAANASIDEVQRAAMEIERAEERKIEAATVERLRDAINSGGAGAAGLADVVAAINERRVDQLVLSDGFEAPGWSCPACDQLATVGRECKICGGQMVELDDLVVEIVDRAMAQSCRVEVCVDNADLDVLGRIGALLRY